MQKPIVAITMGDAAGIGPELIVKVLAQESSYARCRPFVIGDLQAMQEIARVIQSPLRFEPIGRVEEARFEFGVVEVLCPPGVAVAPSAWGRVDAAMGRAAALCMQEGAQLAMAGKIQAMVTGTMNKEAMHLAGFDYPDELSFLSDITESSETFTAGLVGSLWTSAVTEHIPFRAVADQIRQERVLRSIRRMHALLQGVGRSEAKIAVAALNPHAGEGGLFGSEEIEELAPAVQAAQREGIHAQGPFPADTIFVRAAAENFDGVLCMYHDQANIARKLLATWQGATVFMGLPVPCATTAHGTAFDKAGKGISDAGSMRTALESVALLASKHAAAER